MPTVTKKEIIERISTKSKISRNDVKTTVQEFLDQVIVELKRGNRLEFRDFGVFEVRQRAQRTAQNPKTMQRVDVPARKTVKFKVGRLMRESLELADAADRKKQVAERK
ncbi:MAG: integration host factor subunit beta [Planctomycetes bacterium]|nr:integration host factor subunit beta [Planctomycetota bacterium]